MLVNFLSETILDEMLLQIDSVIEQVSDQLPKKFPKHISQAIFDGMRKAKQKII